LALVQELVQLHGGKINVSSTLGQGTCFTIAIPFGSEHLPSERIKASRTLASTAIGAAPYLQEAELWRSPPSQKMPSNARILLVDDNADMRDYLTHILSDRFQVEAVADGAAALAAAQARVPNLILSDIMMPGLDGFQLLEALRNDPRTREVPIILLSARAGEEAIVEGLEAGADDYLIKPFSAQELVSRVNAHLQTAQLRTEALRQERTTSRQKDELLAIVTHELNTPLVAILGWTRLLRANPPNHSVLMKSLDTIERNATVQAKLIQDLLDISRISAGKLRLHLEPVELQSVVEEAIAAVLTAAIAKNIHLQWQRLSDAQDCNIRVLGDRDRLQQILCNLLINAIKFTPEGGRVEVSLSSIQKTNSARIAIADTGIGIAAESLPHIFERFYQAEKSGSVKGLGLGLAIAHHLVELHDGDICAESLGEGSGATVTLNLPLLQDL
jgi:signal transduction histidine kinase